MQKKFDLIIAVAFLFALLITVGCGAPARPHQEPNYPSISDIPAVPVYTDNDAGWDVNTTCWIGVADDPNWNNTGSAYAKNNFSRELLPLIRAELITEGYQVKMFGSDYITREKRLSIQRLILCKGFNINKIMVKEGACYDMKLTLIVVNNLQQGQMKQCEIWGRVLLEKGTKQPWADVYRTCVANSAGPRNSENASNPEIYFNRGLNINMR